VLNFEEAAFDAGTSRTVNNDSHSLDIDTTPLPPGSTTKGEHSIRVVSSEGHADAMNNDNDQPSSREIAVTNKGDRVALKNGENEDDCHGNIRKDDELGFERDVEADRGGSASDEPPTQEILPGAYRVTPSASVNPNNNNDEIIDAEIQHVADARNVVIEAYEIEQQQAPEEVFVVPTIWGIDKKRIYQICVLAVTSLAIVVGVFFTVLLAKNNLGSENATPLLTGEERAQRRAVLVDALSHLNEGRVFEIDGPSSSAHRIAALEWLIDDIPTNVSHTPDGLFGYYLEWKMIQRYILAVLYFSTNGPEWMDSLHFLSSKEECEWHAWQVDTDKMVTSSTKGVECDEPWQIRGINLAYNNAVGTIPPEISFLNESMKTINIGYNAIYSTIPSSFGKLSKLTTLTLSHNCLSGHIPEDIAQLPHLIRVKLFGNPMLTGNLTGVCNGREYSSSTKSGFVEQAFESYAGIDCPGCMTSESLVECECCNCVDSSTFTMCSKGGGPTHYAVKANLHWSKEECTMSSSQVLWLEENCPCFDYNGVCSTDC